MRVGATSLNPDLRADREHLDLLLHTHAQYVLLRNNEDSIMATRFVALLVTTSFLIAGWISASGLDNHTFELRLMLSILGVIPVAIGYLINVAAASAHVWRELALDVERTLYEAVEKNGERGTGGPYGQKLLWDQIYPPNTRRGRVKSVVLWRWNLGRPNYIIGAVIPRLILLFWIAAMAITIVDKFT